MNNKITSILIPVVAIIIIFESIMLVSNLDKSGVSSQITPTVTNIATATAAKIEATPVVDLSFATDTSEMKVGKSYKVTLNITPNQDLKLNALELYIKYDPQIFTVSNLVSDEEIQKPDLMKVSDKKDVIATNFLFSGTDGESFAKDKQISILTFNVVAKKAGVSQFEIGTGDSDGNSATMFVDKVTSKSLSFSSDKLEVNLVN
jgi:hypothetical protein